MTPRSLVGMTQGARKRICRADQKLELAGEDLTVATIKLMHEIRAQYRIGQRLRPCPGCADCDPCMSSYGSFYGGDPRRFTPDEECSTDQERELHRKHCEEWARGERPSVKVSGVEWVDDITYQDSDGKTQTIKAGHKLVERAAYGLGVSRLTDDDSGRFCDGSGVLPAKGKVRR